MTARTDFSCEPRGTLWCLTALTDRAKEWIVKMQDPRRVGTEWFMETWMLPLVAGIVPGGMTIEWTERIHESTQAADDHR